MMTTTVMTVMSSQCI